MRPIDAEALKEQINQSMNRCIMLGGSPAPLAMCIDYINAAPTVEAMERRSDCETCRERPGCQYNRGAHGIVRINCPLWRAK